MRNYMTTVSSLEIALMKSRTDANASSLWRVLVCVACVDQQYIPADIPVVLDAKRGDIGTTAQAYADAAFDELGAESITINAYMGTDTVKPVC
jgi:Orotidine 5'-phosphate decarboxylase / HUMPS family